MYIEDSEEEKEENHSFNGDLGQQVMMACHTRMSRNPQTTAI